jgi:hypothetical protein
VIALDLIDYDRQAGSLKIRGQGTRSDWLAYLAARGALDDWLELRGRR